MPYIWMKFTFTSSVRCFQPCDKKKRKRLWARIDSDVWVKCSVCQMNSDSMFITLLHTALHTHAVFKINKQPSCNLPLSWTKINLALHIHWLPARNHTSLQSSLVRIITRIAQYHRISKNKQIRTTYHSVYGDEIGIHGGNSELDFKERKKTCRQLILKILRHTESCKTRLGQTENGTKWITAKMWGKITRTPGAPQRNS